MKQIFLISGFARNGKDTVADIMMEKLEGRSVKIAMADYLKIIAKKYYDWDGKKDEKGRELLQQLGTERIRAYLGEEFHVHRVCQDIKIIWEDFDYVFIPDCRFKNEILYTQAIFPEHTTSIRVHRLGFESPLTEEQQNHRSEIDLINFRHDLEIVSETGLDKVEEEIEIKLGWRIEQMNRRVRYEVSKL